MLRRTLSSLVPVSSSESKIFSDQENEMNFDPNSLPTPSPNRSKYEGKFVKTKQRRPLEEKTNKSNKTAENLNGKSNEENFERNMKKSSNCDENDSNEAIKEKKTTCSNTNSNSNSNENVSFQDLFHLNSSSNSSNNNNSTSSKVEELSMALSETLKENEQLHDTVSLLKAEIDRLNTELLEYQEYAELYLLGKELIENQAEEIENLKKKLVKRD